MSTEDSSTKTELATLGDDVMRYWSTVESPSVGFESVIRNAGLKIPNAKYLRQIGTLYTTKSNLTDGNERRALEEKSKQQQYRRMEISIPNPSRNLKISCEYNGARLGTRTDISFINKVLRKNSSSQKPTSSLTTGGKCSASGLEVTFKPYWYADSKATVKLVSPVSGKGRNSDTSNTYC